jgi:hypothetical protein
MTNESNSLEFRRPHALPAAFIGEFLRTPAIPRGAELPLVKARAFQAREKQPHQSDGFSRGGLYPAKERVGPACLCAHQSRVLNREIRQKKCHTVQSNSRPISLKTKDRHPHKVTHFFRGPRHA